MVSIGDEDGVTGGDSQLLLQLRAALTAHGHLWSQETIINLSCQKREIDRLPSGAVQMLQQADRRSTVSGTRPVVFPRGTPLMSSSNGPMAHSTAVHCVHCTYQSSRSAVKSTATSNCKVLDKDKHRRHTDTGQSKSKHSASARVCCPLWFCAGLYFPAGISIVQKNACMPVPHGDALCCRRGTGRITIISRTSELVNDCLDQSYWAPYRTSHCGVPVLVDLLFVADEPCTMSKGATEEGTYLSLSFTLYATDSYHSCCGFCSYLRRERYL
jgi:hypothetical protein